MQVPEVIRNPGRCSYTACYCGTNRPMLSLTSLPQYYCQKHPLQLSNPHADPSTFSFLTGNTHLMYSEENVWKLCSLVRDSCPSSELLKCFCVFISNHSRQIPLWHQKTSKNPERLVVWDYHVIFLYHNCEDMLVYDLDTELSFPCALKEYAAACIGDEKILKDEYKRMFRVIQADEFLDTFASDRSHMLNDKNEWLSPPPEYPPIKCSNTSNNIQDFISMDRTIRHGEVFNLQEFLNKFNIHL